MKTALPITERQFSRQIDELTRTLGYVLYHTFLSVRSAPGFPDDVLVRPPRIIFAELKSETGKLTAAQEGWLALLRQCPGVETYVWRPSQLQEIAVILQGVSEA
jgi:hypothetical protein